MTAPRHIWLLSPYHTGSHKSWANGLIHHSKHQIDLLSMAGRFWKWRMQGGAIELGHQARKKLASDKALPDAILATDMVNIPAWLGQLRGKLPTDSPIVLYMHENQLTYPSRPGEAPDLTYAMINWQSMLCANRVAFNSHYHLESWFGEVPKLLKHFPDYNHLELIDEVRAKSVVLPVGIDPQPDLRLAAASAHLHENEADAQMPQAAQRGQSPLILWNQRWEYDKRPDRFFNLLYRLQEADVAFRVAVAGENFRNVPVEFEEAKERLADRIIHWGYVEGYVNYLALLKEADLVISTAIHEFFGISILEAIAAGSFPLLPNRLSYPELIPRELHPAIIYTSEDDLFKKAKHRLLSPRRPPPSLKQFVAKHFNWENVALQYDALLEIVR